MEIPSNATSLILQAKESTLAIDKLQTGRSLNVTIIDQLPTKNEVIVRIGHQIIQAKSDMPVAVGQTLNVLIEKTKTELILKAKPPPQQTTPFNATLRQLLPKQTPVNDFQQPLITLFKNLNHQAIKHSSAQNSELRAQINLLKRVTSQILQSLPRQQTITTAEGLKNAVQHSGVFLEPKVQHAVTESKALLNASNNAAKIAHHQSVGQVMAKTHQQALDFSRVDVKANLARLINVLNAWPKNFTAPATLNTKTISNPKMAQSLSPSQVAPHLTQLLSDQIKELIIKAEGALSKITLNQLASTNAEPGSSRQTLHIEIPFLNQHVSESVYLIIEREKPTSKEQKDSETLWSVSLEMNPPKLGLIKNKLTCSSQRINTSFWAEKPETENLIEQHLDLLRKKFEQAHLQSEKIQLQRGSEPIIQTHHPAESILSEKA